MTRFERIRGGTWVRLLAGSAVLVATLGVAMQPSAAAGPGTLSGIISSAGDPSVEDAVVELCQGSTCVVDRTDATGAYAFADLALGAYQLRVFPPGNLLAVSGFPVNISGPGNLLNIEVRVPVPPPGGTTIDTDLGLDGLPRMTVGEPAELITGACADADVEYAVNGGSVLLMEEDDPGVYIGEILVTTVGPATVGIKVDCPGPGANPLPFEFDFYVDPAMKVVDQYGLPVAGATVTLYTTPVVPESPVPNGDEVMSPSNRANPDTTDHDGAFGWDVIADTYAVQATAPGCVPDVSAPFTVPPVTAAAPLIVELSCDHEYVPVVPKRILDTRPLPDGQIGYTGGKPGDNATVTLDVTTVLSGVPTDAKAVVLNVTGVASTGGFVTVWPCAATKPTASNLNVPAGRNAPNLVIVAPDAAGNVCLFTNKAIHLLADLNGFFPASSTYVPVVPKRLLDTRPLPDGQIGYTGGKPADNAIVTLDVVTLESGVPANAKAVVLNVTGVASTGGFVTVWPCAATQPTASNLNVPTGENAPNLVIVAPDAAGNVCLFTNEEIHLLADLQGYVPASSPYVPVVPKRLLDTRNPPQLGYTGPKPANLDVVELDVITGLSGVPATARAVVLNVTGVQATGGFVTVWPCGEAQPVASNLNLSNGGAGSTLPNLVIVAPDDEGLVCLFVSKSVHLLADLEGYFPATADPP